MRARAALRLVLALCLVSVLPEQGQANGPDDARVIELRVRWACATAEKVNGTCPETEVPDRLEGFRKWLLRFEGQEVVLWPGERVLLRVHPLPGLDTTLTLLGPGNTRIGEAALAAPRPAEFAFQARQSGSYMVRAASDLPGLRWQLQVRHVRRPSPLRWLPDG